MPELPAVDGSSPRQTKFVGEFQIALEPEATYTAVIVTNKGTMTAVL